MELGLMRRMRWGGEEEKFTGMEAMDFRR